MLHSLSGASNQFRWVCSIICEMKYSQREYLFYCFATHTSVAEQQRRGGRGSAQLAKKDIFDIYKNTFSTDRKDTKPMRIKEFFLSLPNLKRTG